MVDGPWSGVYTRQSASRDRLEAAPGTGIRGVHNARTVLCGSISGGSTSGTAVHLAQSLIYRIRMEGFPSAVTEPCWPCREEASSGVEISALGLNALIISRCVTVMRMKKVAAYPASAEWTN